MEPGSCHQPILADNDPGLASLGGACHRQGAWGGRGGPASTSSTSARPCSDTRLSPRPASRQPSPSTTSHRLRPTSHHTGPCAPGAASPRGRPAPTVAVGLSAIAQNGQRVHSPRLRGGCRVRVGDLAEAGALAAAVPGPEPRVPRPSRRGGHHEALGHGGHIPASRSQGAAAKTPRHRDAGGALGVGVGKGRGPGVGGGEGQGRREGGAWRAWQGRGPTGTRGGGRMDPEPSGNRRGRGTWESRRATEQRRRPTFTHIPCPPGDTKAFIWTAVGCPSRTLETPPQGPGIRAPGSGLERGQARDAGCLALAWGGQPPQHRAVAWGPPSLPTKILGVRVEVWGRSPRRGTSSHPQLWPLGHPGSSHSDPGGQAGGPPQTSACAGAGGASSGPRLCGLLSLHVSGERGHCLIACEALTHSFRGSCRRRAMPSPAGAVKTQVSLLLSGHRSRALIKRQRGV